MAVRCFPPSSCTCQQSRLAAQLDFVCVRQTRSTTSSRWSWSTRSRASSGSLRSPKLSRFEFVSCFWPRAVVPSADASYSGLRCIPPCAAAEIVWRRPCLSWHSCRPLWRIPDARSVRSSLPINSYRVVGEQKHKQQMLEREEKARTQQASLQVRRVVLAAPSQPSLGYPRAVSLAMGYPGACSTVHAVCVLCRQALPNNHLWRSSLAFQLANLTRDCVSASQHEREVQLNTHQAAIRLKEAGTTRSFFVCCVSTRAPCSRVPSAPLWYRNTSLFFRGPPICEAVNATFFHHASLQFCRGRPAQNGPRSQGRRRPPEDAGQVC
jgi:hypothetical protein